MNKMNKRNKKLGKGFLLFVVALILMLTFSLASETAHKLIVNGKEIQNIGGGPMVLQGNVYLPVESVVNEMGDKIQTNGTKTTISITQKDGTIVSFGVNKPVAFVGEKATPVHSLEMNGVLAPSGLKPVKIANRPYLPADSFKQLLKYPVEIEKGKNDQITAFVGSKKAGGTTPTPTPTPTPTDPTPPTSGIKEDPRYPFPQGWTPPKTVSKLSNDPGVNLTILQNELGFEGSWYDPNYYGPGLGNGASFYKPDGGVSMGTAIQISSSNTRAAVIQFNYWKGTKGTATETGNKIPYIAKETFRFYLGETDGDYVYNIVNGRANGDSAVVKQLNKLITLSNNRQVEVRNHDGSSTLIVFIGLPGYKYDSGWNKIN